MQSVRAISSNGRLTPSALIRKKRRFCNLGQSIAIRNGGAYSYSYKLGLGLLRPLFRSPLPLAGAEYHLKI